MGQKERIDSSTTEENLQKVLEFARQKLENIKAISVTDLLQQQKTLLRTEKKTEKKRTNSIVFEILVLLGARIDDGTFYYAIDLCMFGLVKLLVEQYGFDANHAKGYVPILVAISATNATHSEDEQVEIVKYLIEKGANIHSADNQAIENAIKIAMKNKKYKVLKTLLTADESI